MTQRSAASGRSVLFAVGIFVNAAVLFLVQPMFGRMVRPRLDGNSAVWATFLLVFETVLLIERMGEELMRAAEGDLRDPHAPPFSTSRQSIPLRSRLR